MEAVSRVSSVSTVHILTEPPRNSGFIPRRGHRLFIQFGAARSVLGPIQLPSQWAPEAPLGAKWPSVKLTTNLRMCGVMPPPSNMPSRRSLGQILYVILEVSTTYFAVILVG
jgi:hypothetical protein